jgi:dipeptidyl aminopeptidase/acylaminoacyl peptidase
MSEKKISPYGSWKSPITTDLIVANIIGLGEIMLSGQDVYWMEMRPEESGRYVIVRKRPGVAIEDVNSFPYNARTRVHEYGGGSYLVANKTVYFSHFDDQRIYRQASTDGIEPITPEGDYRYADAIHDPYRARLICIREDHTQSGKEAINTIVTIDTKGQTDIENLVSGSDFFSNPRLSADGKFLCWLSWLHPNMPWDSTELWMADINEDGSLGEKYHIAGGEDESICQPEWSQDGKLYFISDRNGWWNLYRWNKGKIEPIVEMEAEFGMPQWTFRNSTYAFATDKQIICTWLKDGISYLGSIDLSSRRLELFDIPYTDIESVQANKGKVVFFAASPSTFPSIIELELKTRTYDVLRCASGLVIETGYISIGESLMFPTENNQTAHAFFYFPQNSDFTDMPDEKPPLLVISHGGPTGAAHNGFRMVIQYFTSRGIAVLDVNYGGSSGFGREYRQRLNGQWGIVDVNDCVNGARYLARQGRVDVDRLMIRGSSAGGFTTLAALTFSDVFKAGASHYGVSDLEALTKDTHKFESRYLDSLIGPYPERVDLYQRRSPINAVDKLSCPVIFFQGLEDRIVLPNQAEMMVAALKQKGLPVAYLPYEGEQHGFRQAKNIKRTLDAELYFYAVVFGFELADKVESVEIFNSDAR